MSLPTDAKERKNVPIATGVLDYFPDALAAIAECSKKGNDQHNPGQPLHWSKHLSNDHADCLIRHFLERGTMDSDGIGHSVKVAWRALAMLQIELETKFDHGEDVEDQLLNDIVKTKEAFDNAGPTMSINPETTKLREEVCLKCNHWFVKPQGLSITCCPNCGAEVDLR